MYICKTYIYIYVYIRMCVCVCVFNKAADLVAVDVGSRAWQRLRLAVASMGLHAQIIVLDWRLNEIISRFMLQDELSRLLVLVCVFLLLFFFCFLLVFSKPLRRAEDRLQPAGLGYDVRLQRQLVRDFPDEVATALAAGMLTTVSLYLLFLQGPSNRGGG